MTWIVWTLIVLLVGFVTFSMGFEIGCIRTNRKWVRNLENAKNAEIWKNCPYEIEKAYGADDGK